MGLGKHFWINIVLTLLGIIPGIVHAVWIIAKKNTETHPLLHNSMADCSQRQISQLQLQKIAATEPMCITMRDW